MKRMLIGISKTIFVTTIILVSGCASITGTTGQNVSVETRSREGKAVVGANCELTNSKGKWFVTTPGSVGIRRSNDDMSVICNKDGFEPGNASVVSDTKGSMFGNIIFGGGIGAIIDHNSGSAYEYPTLIQIILGSTIKVENKSPADGAEKPATIPQPIEIARTEPTPAALLPVQSASQSSEVSQGQSAAFKKLKELDALHKEGVLTTQEFEVKKAEILKGM